MKKLLILLGFFTTTCIGQEINCPPKGSSVIGQLPPTTQTITPPINPKNPRTTPLFPNDRIVFWIHGLGGDVSSWSRVAEATQYQSPGQQVPGYPARKVTSLNLTYSQFSLNGAASTLHNMLVTSGDATCVANNITDKSINFIVAHSQGGIVSRATDKMYDDLGIGSERRFGGIITFGTPHGGARIINNIAQHVPFTDEACNALIAGPAEDALQSVEILDFFLPKDTWESIRNGLCNIIANDIAPILLKDQFQPLTEDYKVGAAPLAELNGHNSGIPRVALYGTEEEPVFYRAVYNLKVKTPNLFPVFGADNDQSLVDQFNKLLNEYKAKYEVNKARVAYLESMGLPCSLYQWGRFPIFCSIWDTQYKQKKKKRDAWNEGVLWLNASNNKYKAIIGAYESHWSNVYTCNCNGSTFPTTNPSCPPGCTLAGISSSILVVTDKPSDGAVLAESASAYPGAITVELKKSNHMQMRNDSNTKTSMLKAFEGGYGNYFITAVR